MCWLTCWAKLRLYQQYDKSRQESRRVRAEKELDRKQRRLEREEHEQRIAERLAEIERLILTNDPYPRG